MRRDQGARGYWTGASAEAGSCVPEVSAKAMASVCISVVAATHSAGGDSGGFTPQVPRWRLYTPSNRWRYTHEPDATRARPAVSAYPPLACSYLCSPLTSVF